MLAEGKVPEWQEQLDVKIGWMSFVNAGTLTVTGAVPLRGSDFPSVRETSSVKTVSTATSGEAQVGLGVPCPAAKAPWGLAGEVCFQEYTSASPSGSTAVTESLTRSPERVELGVAA